MGELSAEQIWRWSQAAEANAPIWSRQAWGAWRLGNSLDVKNQEMSETARFGFDAADARGHLGAALGEAVTKLRAHMSGYTANTGELQSAMERVAAARGDTHTHLERLWKRYEASTDKVDRAEIEQEMRARYTKFADDYRGEAASVKDFDAYSGVRKPVDSPTRNSDRLGDNGATNSGGRGWPSRDGDRPLPGDSATRQPDGLHGDLGQSAASSGPDLQSTATSTATVAPGPAMPGPNPPATSGTFHVPTQPTLPPVIGGRTSLPVTGKPVPRLNPSGLVNPVNHGARPTPAVPATRAVPGANPASRTGSGANMTTRANPGAVAASARNRFGGEAGLNRGVITGSRVRSTTAEAEDGRQTGDATETWDVDGDTVRPVITSSSEPEPFHDPGPMAFGPDRD